MLTFVKQAVEAVRVGVAQYLDTSQVISVNNLAWGTRVKKTQGKVLATAGTGERIPRRHTNVDGQYDTSRQPSAQESPLRRLRLTLTAMRRCR